MPLTPMGQARSLPADVCNQLPTMVGCRAPPGRLAVPAQLPHLGKTCATEPKHSLSCQLNFCTNWKNSFAVSSFPVKKVAV